MFASRSKLPRIALRLSATALPSDPTPAIVKTGSLILQTEDSLIRLKVIPTAFIQQLIHGTWETVPPVLPGTLLHIHMSTAGIYTVTLTTVDSTGCAWTSQQTYEVHTTTYNLYGYAYMGDSIFVDHGLAELIRSDSGAVNTVAFTGIWGFTWFVSFRKCSSRALLREGIPSAILSLLWTVCANILSSMRLTGAMQP